MSAAPAPTLDFQDIQGVVLNGYGHLNYSRFVLLRTIDAQSARRWLTHIANEISSAKRRRGEDELPRAQNNIVFTRSGLEKLGLPRDTVAAFPREFQMGIAAPERSRRLGDLGVCAPESWQFGGPNTPEIDLLVMLYARDEAILDHSAINMLGASLAANGVEEIFRQNSIRHGSNEPFGFRDGISQPAIEGAAQKLLPGQSVIKAGEFLLGHVDEYGDLVPVPTVSRELDPDRFLTPDPTQTARASFGHNGSFLVFRKLAQDVKGFQSFVERTIRNADGSNNPDRAKLLSAKMIGRWPSGAPLTLAPEKDNRSWGRTNIATTILASRQPITMASPVPSVLTSAERIRAMRSLFRQTRSFRSISQIVIG